MNVGEYISLLKQVPEDTIVLTETRINTFIPARHPGTAKVIPVYGRLMDGTEFRVPLNDHDEENAERVTAVIIR